VSDDSCRICIPSHYLLCKIGSTTAPRGGQYFPAYMFSKADPQLFEYRKPGKAFW